MFYDQEKQIQGLDTDYRNNYRLWENKKAEYRERKFKVG